MAAKFQLSDVEFGSPPPDMANHGPKENELSWEAKARQAVGSPFTRFFRFIGTPLRKSDRALERTEGEFGLEEQRQRGVRRAIGTTVVVVAGVIGWGALHEVDVHDGSQPPLAPNDPSAQLNKTIRLSSASLPTLEADSSIADGFHEIQFHA